MLTRLKKDDNLFITNQENNILKDWVTRTSIDKESQRGGESWQIGASEYGFGTMTGGDI